MTKQHSNSGSSRTQATAAAAAKGKEGQDPRVEAAQKRLRETVDRADALEAIREIVTNLLGCEEIGLFTVKDGKDRLLWSFGIDPEVHGTLSSFDKSSLRRVLQGEFHVVEMDAEADDDHPPLRAFVPICLNGRTVAVLVMLKLLPQKLGFDQSDIDLVNVLSCESGRALFEGSANVNA